MGELITVSMAKKLVQENISALKQVTVELDAAAGLILAEDLIAPLDIPSYPQSSMDGYAINKDDWEKNGSLKIDHVIAAGSSEDIQLAKNGAARIFTGAAVPKGADTVIMQEHAVIKDDILISIGSGAINKGTNVRAVGSEVQKGTIALPKGSFLSPGAIGFLAAMGIKTIQVIPRPKVAIIVTGNELLPVGAPLKYGMVYDSNSHTLLAAFRQLGDFDCTIQQVHDSAEHLKDVLFRAIDTHDLVVLTGGVSVGDYDYVIGAAGSAGVSKVFHKVRQKPGKPIFFGMKGTKPVFGLPGNPASVLTCFYQYVTIALSRLTEYRYTLPTEFAEMMDDYKKAPGLTHFLKGVYNGKSVFLPEGQESYKLNSFARANCIVEIPVDRLEVKRGEKVEIHRIF